jgi:hypothetical protein
MESQHSPQVEELRDDYFIPFGTTVLNSSEHAVMDQPDESSEDDDHSYSTNSSDWSCEDQGYDIDDQDFEIEIDNENIEDVTDTSTMPCDHTARSFVNVFYGSIASLFSSTSPLSLAERIINIMSLFHPSAFVTLQGLCYHGHENISRVLTSASGFVFEPKSISSQYTYPQASIIILVNGIARTKKKRRRRATGDANDSGLGGIMDTEGVVDDAQEWVWKKFIFSQTFNLVALNTNTPTTEYLILNSVIRTFSRSTRK